MLPLSDQCRRGVVPVFMTSEDSPPEMGPDGSFPTKSGVGTVISDQGCFWIVTAMHVVFDFDQSNFAERVLARRGDVWVPVLNGAQIVWFKFEARRGLSLGSREHDCIAFLLALPSRLAPAVHQSPDDIDHFTLLQCLNNGCIPLRRHVSPEDGVGVCMGVFQANRWRPDSPLCILKHGQSHGEIRDSQDGDFFSDLRTNAGDSGAPIFKWLDHRDDRKWEFAGMHICWRKGNPVSRV